MSFRSTLAESLQSTLAVPMQSNYVSRINSLTPIGVGLDLGPRLEDRTGFPSAFPARTKVRPYSPLNRFGLVWILLLLSPFSFLLGGGETAAPVAPAPAINWVLPLFSDKEGHRTMTLRGTEARVVGKTIVVTDLSITTFSGDAAAKVDSILLSPHAVYYSKENRASGAQTVRFIQDDVEVTGTGWSYDHAAKKVSLREKVRVTFRAKLNDILK